ncbi:unnamed protein product [Adineta steineri]|uniref:Uncharacterized protein n=1 Tax=Adineta steineri TaxID=433720 RepID=A0A820Q8F2_9BILA|nr:unnamed protein product [Adineta steineri]
MLPGSVVIKNYKTASGSLPNQGSIESAWTYHRRFFLLDRISGVTTGGQLTSVRYAKTITILNTLSDGGSYIQPPAVVVEYGELSLSDFGTGKVVQVRKNE